MLIKSERNGHILEHDEEEHLYLLDSKPLTGVTTILHKGYPTSRTLIDWQIKEGAKWVLSQFLEKEIYQELEEIDRDKIVKESPKAYKIALDEAADIGTYVHDYCYRVEAQKPIVALDPTIPGADIIQKCCKQFDEWREANKDEIVALEELVCSPKMMYAGRFDRLANRNGVITLSDYKTSSGFYITQFVQMAAYAMAIEEWMGIVVEDIEIVRFDKKTGKLSTRNLEQVAGTVGLKPKTVLHRLKQQFKNILETANFKDKFDRYIRK